MIYFHFPLFARFFFSILAQKDSFYHQHAVFFVLYSERT